MKSAETEQWVLLAYRLPRVPSTPRSTIWRKLKRLGVVQLSDGLVALPADARTREAMEWIAEEVLDHDGEAMVWLGRPADTGLQSALRDRMTAAIAAEYNAVATQAAAARGSEPTARRRIAARLRRELHRIDGRDFFPTTERAVAGQAVEALTTEPPPGATPAPGRTRVPAPGVRR